MATRSQICKQAKAWLNAKQGSTKHKEIIDTYNSHKPLARGYKVSYTDDWCATYVSAVAIACKATDIIPTECGCEEMIHLFQKKGAFVESDSYKPKKGDIIFYDWQDNNKLDCTGWSDHVGIVLTVSGNNMTIIEGNKNNKVAYRQIAVNAPYIRGYGVPKYSNVTSINTANTAVKVGDTVKVNSGAKTYEGKKLLSFVYGRKHKVKEIRGDRAVITFAGIIVAAVNVKDLTKV